MDGLSEVKRANGDAGLVVGARRGRPAKAQAHGRGRPRNIARRMVEVRLSELAGSRG